MRKIAETCSLSDCNRKYDSKGYCGRHGARFRRYGDPHKVKIIITDFKRSKMLEYNSWINMKQRCLNKNHYAFRYWGGKGIKVCERWLGKEGFLNFLEDMGRKPSYKHSIDRIDGNGNYEPSNCRWASQKEQQLNRKMPLGKSGVKGVTWNKKEKKYMVRKLINDRREFLGYFKTIEEAEAALSLG